MNFVQKSAVVAVAALSFSANAAIVDVGLDGISSGSHTLIDGDGASFAQTFNGQTLAGVSLLGGPSSPLSLAASGNISVAYWSGSNSLLPQPGNAAPLAVLLDEVADSVTWRMGYADTPSSVTIDFFDSVGSLVSSVTQGLDSGYDNYTFSGFGNFSGFSIYNNNDAAGLRYQNFSYNSVEVSEPATFALLGLGLIGLAASRKKAA